MAFRYDLPSPLPHELEGSGSIGASVTDGAGWTRELPLRTAPVRIHDGGLTVVGTLDLEGLRRLVRAFERQARVTSPSYTIAVTPRVRTTGPLGGEPLTTDFAPALRLRLDASRLQLEDEDEGPRARPPRASRTAP